jgi:hypothetical protein
MKYLPDLIKEASDCNERFEESKDLLLCISNAPKLDQLAYREIIKRYDSIIISILLLEDFMQDLKRCRSEDDVVNLLIKLKD